MRNVISHGMFVCEVCDQELLDEKESLVEDGICRECSGENDQDIEEDEVFCKFDYDDDLSEPLGDVPEED